MNHADVDVGPNPAGLMPIARMFIIHSLNTFLAKVRAFNNYHYCPGKV